MREILKELINVISQKVSILSKYGITNSFNGIEKYQNSIYIDKHFVTYVKELLQIHGWYDTVKKEENIIEPIHPNMDKELGLTTYIDTDMNPKKPRKLRG